MLEKIPELNKSGEAPSEEESQAIAREAIRKSVVGEIISEALQKEKDGETIVQTQLINKFKIKKAENKSPIQPKKDDKDKIEKAYA